MVESASSSRVRILESALELFATRGYDATSVREICEAAGITKPTLYHFYGSKEGVFRAVMAAGFDDTRRLVSTALDDNGSVLGALQRIAREFFADARRRPLFWRVVFGMAWSPTAGPLHDLHEFHAALKSALERALNRAVESGELRPGPTDVRFLVLMGGISEALTNHLILGQPDLSDALADALLDSITAGWRAEVNPVVAHP